MKTQWYNFTDGTNQLGIGPLPERSSIYLYQTIGSVITPLAYFRNEEAARTALRIMSLWILNEPISSWPKAANLPDAR